MGTGKLGWESQGSTRSLSFSPTWAIYSLGSRYPQKRLQHCLAQSNHNSGQLSWLYSGNFCPARPHFALQAPPLVSLDSVIISRSSPPGPSSRLHHPGASRSDPMPPPSAGSSSPGSAVPSATLRSRLCSAHCVGIPFPAASPGARLRRPLPPGPATTPCPAYPGEGP